jgi:hypothetical protein
MSHEEVEEVLDFLAKYFVEFDENSRRRIITCIDGFILGSLRPIGHGIF